MLTFIKVRADNLDGFRGAGEIMAFCQGESGATFQIFGNKSPPFVVIELRTHT
jgi:hypothetical protein